MKKHLHTSLILAVALMVGCAKDDPAPVNPVVGEWLLSQFTFTNLTDEFSDWEGFNGTSFWGEDTYQLNFVKDMTYSRELSFSSGNVYTEEGDWESDEQDLFLDPDGSGIGIYNDFKVVEATEKDLTLSADINQYLIPNIYYDTVTQEYIDKLNMWETEDVDKYNAELNRILQLTSITLVYEFDKTND